MKSILITFIGLALGLLSRVDAKSGWTDDFDDAQTQAKKQNKYVLLDFTGSDWCGWCQKLDSVVFATAAFKELANDQLVLVELDFPHNKQIRQAVQTQNKRLAQKYGATGFPTIVLLDPNGSVVKTWAGYSETFLDQLRKALPTQTTAAVNNNSAKNQPAPKGAPSAPPPAADGPLVPNAPEVEQRLQGLVSRNRNTDPFGLAMFPTEKSAKGAAAEKERPSSQVTLTQAVQSLKIGLVNPIRKEFVVHGNNIFQGDTITLAYKGESFAAQVTEVTPFRITFQDLKSHDVAWVRLNMIPTVQAAVDERRHTADAVQKYLLPMEPFNQNR